MSPPLCAMHVQEGLVEIGLCILALGLELLGDKFPSVLSSSTVSHVHYGGVREVLGQEIAGHSILMLPLLPGLNFNVHGHTNV